MNPHALPKVILNPPTKSATLPENCRADLKTAKIRKCRTLNAIASDRAVGGIIQMALSFRYD
jgi:hypothetical protein